MAGKPSTFGSSTKSSIMEGVPMIPVKEIPRDIVPSEPKYNDGVLEGMWRDRRVEKTKACLPPFRGKSTYTVSYKEPGSSAYGDDSAAWDNRAKMEGVDRDVLLEASGPQCRENFTTTTDLQFRWIPQVCPQARYFSTNHMEWLPAQDLLPCLGNLTQFGLKEHMLEKWATERAEKRAKPVTTHRAHFHVPCDVHRVTKRIGGRSRLFSSELQTNNRILWNQRFRGDRLLVVPNVVQGEYPLAPDVCRDRLPIVPELPLEPPPALRSPDRGAGPHPFPDCCVGVCRCRRVPGGTLPTAPALPFYHTRCEAPRGVPFPPAPSGSAVFDQWNNPP